MLSHSDAVSFAMLRGCLSLPSSGTGVMFGFTRGRVSDGIREKSYIASLLDAMRPL